MLIITLDIIASFDPRGVLKGIGKNVMKKNFVNLQSKD